MKTTDVHFGDIRQSVIAVPPLARSADHSLDREANAAIVRHLEDGGIRTLMYGGNANFYNLPISEYGATLDLIEDIAGADTWVIPSAGPDYGRLVDQAAILSERSFPTAMVLPASAPATAGGAARAVRAFAERLGRRVVLYIKSEDILGVDDVVALVEDDLVCAIKYAIVRQDPRQDPYLDRLVDRIDRRRIISGIGERPAIDHLTRFALPIFTSGSVCVAPRASMALLQAIRQGDLKSAEQIRAAFLPLEDQRDARGPIRVLHDAVALAGIAEAGPLLPLLSNLDETERHDVRRALLSLVRYERALRDGTEKPMAAIGAG